MIANTEKDTGFKEHSIFEHRSEKNYTRKEERTNRFVRRLLKILRAIQCSGALRIKLSVVMLLK